MIFCLYQALAFAQTVVYQKEGTKVEVGATLENPIYESVIHASPTDFFGMYVSNQGLTLKKVAKQSSQVLWQTTLEDRFPFNRQYLSFDTVVFTQSHQPICLAHATDHKRDLSVVYAVMIDDNGKAQTPILLHEFVANRDDRLKYKALMEGGKLILVGETGQVARDIINIEAAFFDAQFKREAVQQVSVDARVRLGSVCFDPKTQILVADLLHQVANMGYAKSRFLAAFGPSRAAMVREVNMQNISIHGAGIGINPIDGNVYLFAHESAARDNHVYANLVIVFDIQTLSEVQRESTNYSPEVAKAIENAFRLDPNISSKKTSFRLNTVHFTKQGITAVFDNKNALFHRGQLVLQYDITGHLFQQHFLVNHGGGNPYVVVEDNHVVDVFTTADTEAMLAQYGSACNLQKPVNQQTALLHLQLSPDSSTPAITPLAVFELSRQVSVIQVDYVEDAVSNVTFYLAGGQTLFSQTRLARYVYGAVVVSR